MPATHSESEATCDHGRKHLDQQTESVISRDNLRRAVSSGEADFRTAKDNVSWDDADEIISSIFARRGREPSAWAADHFHARTGNRAEDASGFSVDGPMHDGEDLPWFVTNEPSRHAGDALLKLRDDLHIAACVRINGAVT